MKRLKFIMLLMFFMGIILSFSSCLVTRKHDNGRHRGWFQRDNKHYNDRNRTVWVVEKDYHRQPDMKKSKSSKQRDSKSRKSHKNH